MLGPQLYNVRYMGSKKSKTLLIRVAVRNVLPPQKKNFPFFFFFFSLREASSILKKSKTLLIRVAVTIKLCIQHYTHLDKHKIYVRPSVHTKVSAERH